MVVLRSNVTVLAPNAITNLSASGGTGPYTFSIISGRGTIDSVTGKYTAPSSLDSVTGQNSDVIQAEDSLGEVGQLTLSIMSYIQLFCDIIQNEMGLANGRVFLWDQTIFQPKDEEIYVAVAFLNASAFGITNRFNYVTDESEQSVNMKAVLSVDIQSKSLDAMTRKEEVILALESDYSRRQQAANGFYIGKLPISFVNLSTADGSAIPYRFNISCVMQYSVKKVKSVDYFDDFNDASLTIEQ